MNTQALETRVSHYYASINLSQQQCQVNGDYIIQTHYQKVVQLILSKQYTPLYDYSVEEMDRLKQWRCKASQYHHHGTHGILDYTLQSTDNKYSDNRTPQLKHSGVPWCIPFRLHSVCCSCFIIHCASQTLPHQLTHYLGMKWDCRNQSRKRSNMIIIRGQCIMYNYVVVRFNYSPLSNYAGTASHYKSPRLRMGWCIIKGNCNCDLEPLHGVKNTFMTSRKQKPKLTKKLTRANDSRA